MLRSYIAIGDSFTEGLGDPRADGSLRGWADRLAAGLADHLSAVEPESPPLQYANLAIRGRKLEPIIDEQFGPALEQKPDLISFAGGGNNMLRPKFDVAAAVEETFRSVNTLREGGAHVLLLSGPDPVNNLPLGPLFSRRAAQYTELATERAEGLAGVTFVDNYNDRAFEDSTYWSADGLHLSPAGHLRIAANCLDALRIPYPLGWGDPRVAPEDPKDYHTPEYFLEYVAPWIGRRLTGRSSGDGRIAKRPFLTDFDPRYDL